MSRNTHLSSAPGTRRSESLAFTWLPLLLPMASVGLAAVAARAEVMGTLRLAGQVRPAMALTLLSERKHIPLTDLTRGGPVEIARIRNQANLPAGYTLYLSSANGGELAAPSAGRLPYQVVFNSRKLEVGTQAQAIFEADTTIGPRSEIHRIQLQVDSSATARAPAALSPHRAIYDTLTLSIVSH